MSSHIHLAISGHGYGHLTQIAAVTNALLEMTPDLKITVESPIMKGVIEQFIAHRNIIFKENKTDIGMVQLNPIHVDLDASYLAYQTFHNNYPKLLTEEINYLNSSKPDLLIADVPYLPIEAANRTGIPSVAIASLSWDHIVSSYFDTSDPVIYSWLDTIKNAYGCTDIALLPTPAMPAASFSNSRSIEPIINLGVKLHDLRQRLGIHASDLRPLVLCSLGGINNNQVPISALQQHTNYHWLVTAEITQADNVHSISKCASDYRDIVASVDAIVGKPGYGMSVEAAALGIPFLFARRGDFPDEPYIIDWLNNHANVMEISISDWFAGRFTKPLSELLTRDRITPASCDGANQAAQIIYDLLH